ncbi:MAG: ribosomal-processing cysteine protease Prp [Ruminococcaceae bacterium]|nr:ribosomal-processing cysteine protease Prp [Oscillospiraceae bacterium]
MICIYADREGQKYRLLAKGHADDGDADGALVCAAVSALTGALLQFARSQESCRFLRATMSHGYVFFSCRGGLKNAFEMIVAALSALARQYPRHISMMGVDKIAAASRCEKAAKVR